jgi:hypothetical protein
MAVQIKTLALPRLADTAPGYPASLAAVLQKLRDEHYLPKARQV